MTQQRNGSQTLSPCAQDDQKTLFEYKFNVKGTPPHPQNERPNHHQILLRYGALLLKKDVSFQL